MKQWFKYDNIWVRNVIFAILFYSIVYLQEKFIPAEYKDVKAPTEIENFIIFCLTYFFIFINNHFIVRKFLFEKKYSWYAIVSILYILALSFFSGWVSHFIKSPSNFISDLISTLMSALTGTAFYFIHTWILTNIIKTQKKLLEKETELTFLKHQLSPHFLFNAINNLYGTALAAPEIISDKLLELSDLLRYQIESASKDLVKIEDEMEFVENYISYTNYKSNNLVCTNETVGSFQSYYLPPLIFLPLIENAIKYASETENPFIHIKWKFEQKTLAFQIENSCLTYGSRIKGTKVGLENLQKRIEILGIKNKLQIDTSNKNIYKTDLKIWELSTSV
jgi:two-component system, LytTR family, sensor kinase